LQIRIKHDLSGNFDLSRRAGRFLCYGECVIHGCSLKQRGCEFFDLSQTFGGAKDYF
jgi:hypothetical protein